MKVPHCPSRSDPRSRVSVVVGWDEYSKSHHSVPHPHIYVSVVGLRVLVPPYTASKKGRMMTERKAKPKAKRKSRVGGALKPAAKATKTATAGTKAKSPPKADAPASQLSDQRVRDLTGWRGETLARMRALILEADPKMIEERKWRKPSNAMAGVPVWSHHGIVCTGETYSKVVKLTFARGASLPDPSRLFNSSLEGNTRRAIDIHEGEQVDARAFQTLVKAAVAQNDVER